MTEGTQPEPERPAWPELANAPEPANTPELANAPKRSRWAALGVGVVVAASGALLGWLWTEVTPRLLVIKSDPCCLYAEPEPEQPIAADGWFAILGGAAGVALALLAWFLLRRYRGVGVLLGLTVGSLVAAVLAWFVGYRISQAEFHAVLDAAANGDTILAPLRLAIADFDPDRAWQFPTGVAAVQALAATFTYAFLAGFSVHPDLRGEQPDDQRPDQLTPGWTGNSDSDIGTART